MKMMLPAVLVTVLLLGGCDGPTICLPVAFPSVEIKVQDTAGRAARADTVTYSVDGGAPRVAMCTDVQLGPPQMCVLWQTEEEESGTFVITAMGCGTQASTTVIVERDECGLIIPQRAVVVLAGSC